jgi:hypothetical protein
MQHMEVYHRVIFFAYGKIIAEASHGQIDVSCVYDPVVGMMLIQEESARFREPCWSC